MPIGAKNSRAKRGDDRPLRPPPHVPIRALREATETTLEELAAGLSEILGSHPSRGTLSAIESGRRGASPELLAAIEEFFCLTRGTITTTYRPRPRARSAAA